MKAASPRLERRRGTIVHFSAADWFAVSTPPRSDQEATSSARISHDRRQMLVRTDFVRRAFPGAAETLNLKRMSQPWLNLAQAAVQSRAAFRRVSARSRYSGKRRACLMFRTPLELLQHVLGSSPSRDHGALNRCGVQIVAARPVVPVPILFDTTLAFRILAACRRVVQVTWPRTRGHLG
jgi:hypothetical protein